MHVRSFKSACSALAVLIAMTLTSLYADASGTPAEIQKARHDHYRNLGEANKVIRDQSRAGKPDFAAMEKAAEEVQQASINQAQWFPKGTGPEAGKTRALPAIWTKPDDFAAAQKMFTDRAPKLLAAVKTKDKGNIQGAFRDVGASCKNCHDSFRSPED